MLQEEVGRFSGLNGEVLLDFLALTSTEGRIGQHDVVAVLLLDVHHVLVERVRVDDVGRINAVENQIHDTDDVRQALLFLAVER